MSDGGRARSEAQVQPDASIAARPVTGRPTVDAAALADLPPTGAWSPGDEQGHRRHVAVTPGRPFALEGGGMLREVSIAYETWGTLDDDGGNAILVCHALTGDSHAAGPSGHGHPEEGWWDELIGPGRALDTDRFFVVASNVLGGCQGSTGPASEDPATGRPYGSSFPVVSIRDMVRAQGVVADHLGIARWHLVVGGSMGGMQVLEWGVMHPERVRALAPLASCVAASALQIALSAVERSAIQMDPGFHGGDYYDAAPGEGPHRGLGLARKIAQISYRSDAMFTERFGRKLLDPLDQFTLGMRFDVEGYLDYHAVKLARRFDANTYLRLSKAMDLHDLGRSRGGVGAAMERITAPTLTMGITSDGLYPIHQQELLRDVLASNGVRVQHTTIESDHGHDAFLIEHEQVGTSIRSFLELLEDIG